MKKSLIALLFLVACGKNATTSQAEKYLVPVEKPQALNASIKLKSLAKEIIILAFPEESEVANFSYKFSKNETFQKLFKPLPYLERYLSDITNDMTPVQKVQGIMERVIAVSDARDNARRMSWDLINIKLPPSIAQDIKTIEEKLNNELPCYRVTKGPDKNKCYLEPKEEITTKGKKEFKIEDCEDVIKSVNSYLKSPQLENNASSNLVTLEQLHISEEEMNKFKNCNQFQKESEEIIDLSDLAKQEVVSFLGGAQVEGKDRLVFVAASEIDDSISGDHTVIFNPKTKTFEKFSVTMEFYDGSKEKDKVYGPEYRNMSQPTVTEINGSGFYRVDFEIYTPNFTIKTLGLSLALDPILGLRISGKTKLEYKDGRTRAGIMRIDVAPTE